MKPGKYKVDVMDGVVEDLRASELAIMMASGIRNNYTWYLDYIESYKNGIEIPYHPNFEMSENEYNELQDRIKNTKLFSTATENVKVISRNNKISFKPSSGLEILESVTFDLNTNTVKFGDNILNFSDTVNVLTKDNPLRIKWKGYTWVFSDPDPINLDLLKDLYNLNAKLYRVTVGLIEESNHTYLSIKGRVTSEGIGTIEFEYPLIFIKR